MSTPARTSTVTDCSGQQFCQGGNCFNKGSPNDPDFARSMALMEAAREAGTYGSETEVFRGTGSSCRIKLFGLANCCKASGGGGGYSNNLLFNVAAQVGGEMLSYGSKYTYDALYNSDAPEWMIQGINAMAGGEPTPLANWSPSMSLYGLTVSTGPITGSGFLTNMGLSLGAPVQLGSFGGFTFAFDPTSFAIQIGIMILQDLLSCDPNEQILAMKRGQNLCYEVGTYCSSRIPIIRTCIEHTKSYCCYNSRLARIINEQGRGQIGKGWGNPESPNCAGFSPTEFATIDFSRIDMSEFTAEIMASISIPSVSGISQNSQGVVQQKLQNYYQSGRQ
jgi:conjugal transfer mating pair stabilization protein TraN